MLKDSPLEKDIDFPTFVQYVKDEMRQHDVKTTLKVRAQMIGDILVLFSPLADQTKALSSGYKLVKDLLKTMK